MKNTLFVISGPSGVGKGTLVRLIMRERSDLSLSVSCTTRPPRVCERDGVDYFFLSREEFLKRAERDGFLEYDEHFGNFYGTPRSFVQEKLKSGSVVLEIDVVGALKVKEACARSGEKPVLILIAPPDLETLKSRLSGRKTESEEETEKRLERVRYEMAQREKYDYVVVNDDLNTAKQQLLEIIKKEEDR